MKTKRIIRFLLACSLLLTLLCGCQAKESETAAPQADSGQLSTEYASSQVQREVAVQVYPADLRFTDCADIELPASQEEIAPTEETQPPETTAPIEEIQPPEEETQPPEMIGEPEHSPRAGDNPVRMQSDEIDGIVSAPPEQAAEEIADIRAFRFDEGTDPVNGQPIYRIQIQIQADSLTILSGKLWPGEKVVWDENNGDTSEAGIAYEDILLKKKLEAALLAEVPWVSCTEAKVYAHNLALTQCMISDETVIYTDDAYTVFQLQNYDTEGALHSVVMLSQTQAKSLMDGTIGQAGWMQEQYPVLHLTLQEAAAQENLGSEEAYSAQIQAFEEQNQKAKFTILSLCVTVALLVLTNLVSLICLWRRKNRKHKKGSRGKAPEQSAENAATVKSIGTVHNIGGRSGQQDSFDVINCAAGTLAVVADGMGGLSDGDKVSQKIVATMRADSARIHPGQTDKVLCQLVAHANQEVNRMLGTARQYKCGSTLLAVLVEKNTMQWITVGDSRIYLYRGGSLIQINREHIYCSDLLEKAINGKMSFGDALRDPQADRLSSFIGMGELKHVDICLNRLKLCAGDRILLMSDGVFNTLTNEEIARVIQSAPDAAAAASHLEQRVLQKNAPNQDNFTCVILEV